MPKAFLVRKRPLHRFPWKAEDAEGTGAAHKTRKEEKNFQRGEESGDGSQPPRLINSSLCEDGFQGAGRDTCKNLVISARDIEPTDLSRFHVTQTRTSNTRDSQHNVHRDSPDIESFSRDSPDIESSSRDSLDIESFSPQQLPLVSKVRHVSKLSHSPMSPVFTSTSSASPSSQNRETIASVTSAVSVNTMTSSALSSNDTNTNVAHIAVVPNPLPGVIRPYSGLSQNCPPLLSKDRFPFPPTSLPLSPRDVFYPPPPHHSDPHVFNFPPSIVRPIPTSGLPWPIQPVPLRVPIAHRPDFGVCGVVSPEEIPSPSGSAVADMPASPILGVRSPGLDPMRGFSETGLAVDMNNNSNSGLAMGGSGEDAGGRRSQSFRVFLESAKVRVETINDGNGLKNPLLTTDKARLPMDTGPLSFMTLDAFPSCPVCGMKCDTPRLLQRHVRSHKEIKRYLCAWCGKGFNDTFDLKRHTRTHTGVRPYKCESCGKAFTQRCSLESHCRKIHGLTLPFSFNERRAKLYVCEECGHSTSGIENHFRHLRAQHPGHPALGRPHHDRRQYKFCSQEGERDEEEDEDMKEDGDNENMSPQQFHDEEEVSHL